MGYLSRLPNSNEPSNKPSRKQNPWGGVDGFALLLNRDGARCVDCKRVTRNCFLEKGLCPDCYFKEHGRQSPALERYRNERNRDYGGGACGEAGEAD